MAAIVGVVFHSELEAKGTGEKAWNWALYTKNKYHRILT